VVTIKSLFKREPAARGIVHQSSARAKPTNFRTHLRLLLQKMGSDSFQTNKFFDKIDPASRSLIVRSHSLTVLAGGE
jgi:hypothetical protein